MAKPGISYSDTVKYATKHPDVSGPSYIQLLQGTEVLDLLNMKTPQPRKVARITPNGSNEIHLWVKWGGVYNKNLALNLGCIGLINHNLGVENTVTMDLYIYDSNTDLHTFLNLPLNYNGAGGLSGYENSELSSVNHFTVLDTPVKDAVEVTIVLKNVMSDFDIGRLWVGDYLEACFDAGWGLGYTGKAKINYSAGEDAHPVYSRRRKKASHPISNIHKTQAFGPGLTFQDLSLKCGRDSEIVLLPRTDSNEDINHISVYGLVQKDIMITHTKGDYFQTQIDVIELI
jgi:hypothetical protein